jgi:hypothetical protein
MQLTPIFDTSALINLSREGDLDSVVKRLKPLLPSHGCPLSFITALELFRGLSNGDPEKVADTLKPLLLAARISRNIVLRTPLNFASWELFQVEEAFRHQPKRLVDWLKRIQMPDFVARFASGEVEMDFAGINQIFLKIEQEGHLPTEMTLDRWYPGWREERRNGSALPENLREMAKQALQFNTVRNELPDLFLKQLEIERTPANIGKATIHCDAYFTFQVNILRASLIGNYNFEKKPTDFHDSLQFLYLTRPWFCLVTDDRPSLDRTRQSSQHTRIMSLGEFLGTAA